jgi:hypothetical protein
VDRKSALGDSGDVCRARNMQRNQRVLGLLFRQTLLVHDREDSAGDIGITEYFV